MSKIRIWILFLAASCGAYTAPARQAPAPGVSAPSKTIYLLSHGWHAGIVLQRAEIGDSVWPEPVDCPDAQYLEVGWGDMDYYQTPDPHQGLIFKAALLPTASVLHIVGFSGPVPAYFPTARSSGSSCPLPVLRIFHTLLRKVSPGTRLVTPRHWVQASTGTAASTYPGRATICSTPATSGSPGRCAPPVFPSPRYRPLAWKTSCPRRAILAWWCNRGRNLRSSVCDMGNGKSESRMVNRHTINLTLTVYQPT